MLAHPIAAALLFGTNYAAAITAPRPKKAPNKLDFLRAMNIHTNNIKAGKQRKLERSSTGDARVDFQNELLHGKTKSSAALRKKVIEKSTFVKKTPSAAAAPDDAAGRKLANNNNGYKYNENYSGNDDWYNNQADLWENDFGFNVLQYSVSYAGCAAVKQFDEGEFSTKRFVTFRLCPEHTCSGWEFDYEDNSGCGCGKQCNDIADYEDAQGYAGFDEDSCMNACFAQCLTWGNVNGGNNRRLEDAKNYNWQDGADEEDNEYSNYEFDAYYKENNAYEWGANGEGCSSDYGEYMMEMNEYLELQMQWQEQRIETYQEYCGECMQAVYQAWIKSQGRERHLTYEEFKDSDEHRRLGNPKGACPQYETCRYYNKIEVDDPYSEYFECKEVEGQNGQVAYIGPHCAEGGYEITLGLYSDDQCEEYIGNSASIVKYLGEEVNEDAMKSYYASAHGYALDQLQFVNDEETCISCNTADLMWDVQMFHESDDQYDYITQYDYNANQEYESQINELCSNLYQSSARCDKNFNSYKYKQEINHGEYDQSFASEDLVCEFIDSVAQRNYGEDGFVNVDEDDYLPNTKKWGENMRVQQYGQAVEKVTGMQVFGLVMSLALLAGLAMWAGSLHKSLSKSNAAWRPKKGMASTETDTGVEDLRRENSGVVMGRSATNTSYYMS